MTKQQKILLGIFILLIVLFIGGTSAGFMQPSGQPDLSSPPDWLQWVKGKLAPDKPLASGDVISDGCNGITTVGQRIVLAKGKECKVEVRRIEGDGSRVVKLGLISSAPTLVVVRVATPQVTGNQRLTAQKPALTVYVAPEGASMTIQCQEVVSPTAKTEESRCVMDVLKP